MGYINSHGGYKSSMYNWPFIIAISAFLIVAVGMGLMKYLTEHGQNGLPADMKSSEVMQTSVVAPSATAHNQDKLEQKTALKTLPKTTAKDTALTLTDHSAPVSKTSTQSEIHSTPNVKTTHSEPLPVSSAKPSQESLPQVAVNVRAPTKEFYCSTSDEQAGFCQSK